MEDNIKIHVIKIGADLIQLVQKRVQWQYLVSTIIGFQVL